MIKLYTNLYRSNPAIIREIQVSEDIMISDMIKAVALAYGVGDLSGECHIEKEKIEKNIKFSEIPDREGHFSLYNEEKKNRNYIIYWKAEEKPDNKKAPQKDNIPVVTDYEGINLTEIVYDPKEINFIQMKLASNSNANTSDGNFYTDSLFPNERKIENSMRKYFAPETALKEVNRKNCLPFAVILNSFKLSYLKYLADILNLYMYGNSRKVDYVNEILTEYNGIHYMEELFDEMSLTDYEILKELAYAENEEEKNKIDVSNKLHHFFKYGYLALDENESVVMGDKLMDYIDDLSNSGREEDYIKNKKLKRATLICCNYYGVFNREIFERVVEITEESGIKELDINNYYTNKIIKGKIMNISELFLEDAVHCTSMISDTTAQKIWEAVSHDLKNHYFPPKEELLGYEYEGPGFSEKNKKTILELISKYSMNYYYHYNPDWQNDPYDKYLGFVNRIRSSYSEQEMENYIKTIFNRLYSLEDYEKEEIIKKVKNILKEESKNLPVIIYGGYSATDCPENIKKEADDRLEKIKKNPINKKNKASKAKTAVKKQTGRMR